MIRHWSIFCTVQAISLFVLSPLTLVQAQITPDGTLSTNVKTSDQLNFTITGDSKVGGNLFHSFDQFSIPTNGSAIFNNGLDIQNIINRVTGGSISNIDGLIRANGTANVFILNPNGIIFGSNAALDIGGSFIASTAHSLKFDDGIEFSARDRSTSPRLTMSIPVGLQFGNSVGSIINRSQASPNGATNALAEPAGLQVQLGKTLALIGGEVLLEGGNLTAPGGRVELGSVAINNFVNLKFINQTLTLSYNEVQNFQDIHLSQASIIDVTQIIPFANIGSGDVQVQGNHITLTDGSQISSITVGSVSAGTINVIASDSLELLGTSEEGFSSNLDTRTFSDGKAGDLRITTERLIIKDGAGVSTSSTFFSPIQTPSSVKGQSGNVRITASESVEIIGSSPQGGASAVTVATDTAGNAGILEINTQQLIIRAGGQVSAATVAAGQGGTLVVNASDSVEISGIGIDKNGQVISSTLETDSLGTGNAGNLAITTNNLRIQDGGKISAVTSGTGQGGTLTVSASDTVEVIGQGLGGDGRVIPSRLEVSSEGTGDAGNLEIATNNLRLRDGAEIRATSTQAGGGNIDITAEDIRLRDGSLISASVFRSIGGGGNITINSDVFIALEDSDILANAFDGRGGNIEIVSPVFLADLFSSGQATAVGRNPGSFEPFRGNERVDISVEALGTSSTATSGSLSVSSLSLDQNSISSLSTTFVPPEQVIADSCLTHRNKEQGSFIVTGTGGLPNTPYDPLQGRYTVTQVQGITGDGGQQATTPRVNSPSSTPSFWKPGDPIQEARGMMVTSDGRIIVGTAPELVAMINTDDLICYQAASPEE
ncbi:two-partner secretion domain-containing protein [Coleofasciculus sp.]|uniref:two-partner secretion domain-containing protein n=1 Tax=Coleofasciculus sp. TaxID=3100458 RepID=UPI0039FAA871